MTSTLTTANHYGARIQSAQPVDKSGEKLGATGGQPHADGGEDADNQERRCGRSQLSYVANRYCPHALWTWIAGTTCGYAASPHDPPALLRLRPLLYLQTSQPTVGCPALRARRLARGPAR